MKKRSRDTTPADSEATDPRLGVVIPTLNEAKRLPALLADLRHLPVPHRVVVVDGGSEDGTTGVARREGALVRRAPRGRAAQLNAGARTLETPWLLFLHADVRLPPRTREALGEWLDRAGPERAAVFRFRLEGDHWFWRFVEVGQRLREGLTGLAYGDQGLVVHRATFREAGGYPDLPLMEDVELVRRLRRSHRVDRIPAPVLSSPRRYEREGRWFGWLRNTTLISLHLLGVSPGRLARWYREPDPDPLGGGGKAGGRGGGDDRTLLVFAKAPREGTVKTRLARDVGHERATRIYRRLGRRVVDQVRDGPYRTVVWYDPPDAEDEVRSWLGPEGLAFRAQEGDDLGARMAAAFRDGFRTASRVCIIGTDTPSVDRSTVSRALAALDGADAVLGPSSDGGYYLLALDRHRPELFHSVAWSTPQVLSTTLQRAEESGLRVRLLDERTDLDTAEDLEALGLDRPAD